MSGESPKPAGRTGLFLTICVFSFLVNFGRVAFAPLVDFFINSGINPATAGLAATAVWVGSALPRLPTGYLLTIVSRHRTLLGMGLFLAATAAFTALAPGIWFTVAGALLIGIATGVFYVAGNPFASELYPRNVGTAVGVVGGASQIAAVAAPFAVATAVAAGSWRYTFAGMAVLALAGTVAFVLATRRAELPTAGTKDRDLLGGIRAQWPYIVAGTAFVGITSLVWQGVFNFYVTYLDVAKGVPTGTATTLLTLTFAAGVPSFLVAGRLADWLSYLRLLLAILGGFVLTLLAFTMVEGILAIAIVSALMGFVIHSLFPVGDAYLLDSLPDENRASAYSGYSAAIMLIQAPGSVAVGVLVEAGLTYDAVFVGSALVIGAITVGMGVLSWGGRLPSGS